MQIYGLWIVCLDIAQKMKLRNGPPIEPKQRSDGHTSKCQSQTKLRCSYARPHPPFPAVGICTSSVALDNRATELQYTARQFPSSSERKPVATGLEHIVSKLSI